jgi:hypothetical protein
VLPAAAALAALTLLSAFIPEPATGADDLFISGGGGGGYGVATSEGGDGGPKAGAGADGETLSGGGGGGAYVGDETGSDASSGTGTTGGNFSIGPTPDGSTPAAAQALMQRPARAATAAGHLSR